MKLSKEYWKVKQQKRIPIIDWKVLRKYHTYNKKKIHRMLCLKEKYKIASYD